VGSLFAAAREVYLFRTEFRDGDARAVAFCGRRKGEGGAKGGKEDHMADTGTDSGGGGRDWGLQRARDPVNGACERVLIADEEPQPWILPLLAL
jgi:hypothetical protein